MRPHLKLLPALLINMRTPQHRIPLNPRRHRNRPAYPRICPLRVLHNLARRSIQRPMVVRFHPYSNPIALHAYKTFPINPAPQLPPAKGEKRSSLVTRIHLSSRPNHDFPPTLPPAQSPRIAIRGSFHDSRPSQHLTNHLRKIAPIFPKHAQALGRSHNPLATGKLNQRIFKTHSIENSATNTSSAAPPSSNSQIPWRFLTIAAATKPARRWHHNTTRNRLSRENRKTLFRNAYIRPELLHLAKLRTCQPPAFPSQSTTSVSQFDTS